MFAVLFTTEKPDMVTEKKNVTNFLGSAHLENSKQCKEDAQFVARVSSNLYVHFHCCSCSFSSILND